MFEAIINENCMDTMRKLQEKSVNVIMTSPLYNSNTKAGGRRTITTAGGNTNYLRYDVYSDGMNDDEYMDWTVRLFNEFDRILTKNGVVLYNLSYGNQNPMLVYDVITRVNNNTTFTVADTIVWKKSNALSNNQSHNRLTRIYEFVFVMCRKDEMTTFTTNKVVSSLRPSGQKLYKNIDNFIEAKNNDGSCPLNKATYSSELCEKLLRIYAPLQEDTIVYDPFMGTGTTAVACRRLRIGYLGSEISAAQCEWARDRLMEVT